MLIIQIHEPCLEFMLTSQLKHERILKLIISFHPCDGDFSKQENINWNFRSLRKRREKQLGEATATLGKACGLPHAFIHSFTHEWSCPIFHANSYQPDLTIYSPQGRPCSRTPCYYRCIPPSAHSSLAPTLKTKENSLLHSEPLPWKVVIHVG